MSSTDHKIVLQRVREFRRSIPKDLRIAFKKEFAAATKIHSRVCPLNVIRKSESTLLSVNNLSSEIHPGKPSEQRKIRKLIYRYLVGTFEPRVCPNCNAEFFNESQCCCKSCSVTHTRKNPAVIEKLKSTWKENWVEGHPMKCRKVIKGIREHFERKYGKGVTAPALIPGMKELREERCLKKRGVRHHLQDPEVRKKQQERTRRAKRVKIQGRTVVLQGYEPQVAFAMLEEFKGSKFIENNLALGYYDPNEGDRVYYPDFQIKTASDHYVVEVKSVFTLLDDLEVNLLKFEAGNRWAKLNGKTFILAVYDRLSKTTHAVAWPNLKKVQRLLPRYDRGHGFPKLERFLRTHQFS